MPVAHVNQNRGSAEASHSPASVFKQKVQPFLGSISFVVSLSLCLCLRPTVQTIHFSFASSGCFCALPIFVSRFSHGLAEQLAQLTGDLLIRMSHYVCAENMGKGKKHAFANIPKKTAASLLVQEYKIDQTYLCHKLGGEVIEE
jgi:hypothetical protein